MLLGGLAAAIISHSNSASTPSADGASQPGAPGPLVDGPAPVVNGPVLQPVQVASVTAAASAPESARIVPNLLGLTVSAALKALEQNGLVIGVDDKDPGASGRHVATQSIMPGEHVPPGTAVTVTLGPAPVHKPNPKPPGAYHASAPTPPEQHAPAPPIVDRGAASPAVDSQPVSPPIVVRPRIDGSTVVDDQPADWPDVVLYVALLALAGAAAYKWWPRPHLVCRISMRADAGQQSCRMSSRHAHLPSVDVRLASQPWEAHVVDASRPPHRERDHVRRPRHA